VTTIKMFSLRYYFTVNDILVVMDKYVIRSVTFILTYDMIFVC